jgi:nucleoside-diphosphate-sugar epimerase
VHIDYFVDVSDDAKLHIAALLNPDVKGERLFGYAEPFNYNDLVKTLRKLHPDHKFPDEIDGIGRDMSTVPNGRAEELLKPFGLEGWTRLEASLKANTALLAKQAV